ncbi:MAG: secretin and TonB N-terminal domain-containing protein, partial [Candidatus Sumerlaeia bacterium]|nr:secretin and TonB N-terminal domain-containing protein [Candidatus Sumerlaeia bacterium]
MLASSSALAGPTVGGWQHDTDGRSEQVTLRWSEAGSYDLTRFPQARQIVAVLPHAKLDDAAPRQLRGVDSRVLNRARIQEVTLANGVKGLQLTLNLAHWVEVESVSTEEGLVISYQVPEGLSKPAVETLERVPAQGNATGGLIFTDAKIDEMMNREFGSWDAPPTGAGQGESTISDFYVPPAVEREERGVRASRDMELTIQTRLNETVARVDLQGSSLENVVRLISEQAEINLLVRPSDVAGRTVTLRLRNVTLRQMLDALLKSNDLGYTIEDGGILRIVPRDQVKSTARETITESIPINWVDANEVAAALAPFIDESDGTIQVTRANNSIIVRDVPENLAVIQDLITRIDVPEKQVLIELRLVNMTESARRAIGTRTEFRAQETTSQLRAGEGGSLGEITTD